MTDAPFHKTELGLRFYDETVPALVRELARLNELLARLVAEIEAGRKPADRGHSERA